MSTVPQTELRKNERFKAFTKTIERENSQNKIKTRFHFVIFSCQISLSLVVIKIRVNIKHFKIEPQTLQSEKSKFHINFSIVPSIAKI